MISTVIREELSRHWAGVRASCPLSQTQCRGGAADIEMHSRGGNSWCKVLGLKLT